MTYPTKENVLGSRFFYNEEAKCMFVCYQPKRNKTVSLLSSLHARPEISRGEKKKPEVIRFYNENKVGVDVFDQMARLYSCHSASRRWPLAVWSNILDIAGINAHVIYNKCAGSTSVSRRAFLTKLISGLVGNEVAPTSSSVSSPPSSSSPPSHGFPGNSRKRRKCRFPLCSNMTLSLCENCKRPTCGSCSKEDSKIIYVTCKNC